ncbi:putative ABC transport system permease protein [Nocardiopsis flavescens]|uniref:Putative ABC transport system permease protein n=1 Tax=Nocardiopsis flavescens TaxID=758803 RepID=A0A1M6CT62_9ACTN|nr:ABC transporter permease [Nocardiopsis flavescens]SHI64207.1 putative ABC transport system permease protein [Nocardiopsis flavescens]
MTALVLRGLRARAGSLAVSVLTLALGAGLTTAALSLQHSADLAAADGSDAAWRLSGAPVVVVAETDLRAITATPSGEPPRLDPGVLTALADLPGVERVEAEAPFAAYVVADGRTLGGQADRSWGHSWALARAERLTPEQGREPRDPGEIAVDARTAAEAGLGPGDRTEVLTADGTFPALVTGVLAPGAGGDRERALFFAPGEAAERGGAPVLAAVLPREGADTGRLAREIAEQVPGTRVLTGADRGDALALDRAGRELGSGMGRFLGTVAVLAFVVAGVMVSGLMNLSVRRRSREFALLRLAGATPGLVRRLVLGEALVLGAVAAVLSLGAGVAAAVLLRGFFAAMGVLPAGFDLVIGWSPPLAGAALALAVPPAASWRPVLAAGRTAPVEALRTAAADPAPASRARLVLGALTLLGAAALFAVSWAAAGSQGAVVAAYTAAMVLVLGIALLTPDLVRAALFALRPLTRGHPASLVVHREALADPRRFSGVVTPLTVTAAVACLLMFQGSTATEARLYSLGERLGADLVVAGPEGVGVPRDAAERAARVPGVAAAGGFRQTVASGGGPYMFAYTVDPGTVPDLFRLRTEQGEWGAFDESSVAVRADVAAARGWAAGEEVTLAGPDGREFGTAVAVVYRAGLDFPELLLPRDRIAPRMLDGMDSGVYVALDPGADPDEAARLLARELDGTPGLRVMDRGGHLADQAAAAEEDGWITHLMVALVAGFAAIGAVNTLVVSGFARARGFALLRLVGASRRQVAGMVAGESLATSCAAVALGTAAAALGLACTGYAFTAQAAVLSMPLERYLPMAAAVVGIGLLANLAPLAVVLRARPVHAAAPSA